MILILAFMLFNFSIANECLTSDYIDIRTNRSLYQSALYAQKKYSVPMKYSYEKLQCIEPNKTVPSKITAQKDKKSPNPFAGVQRFVTQDRIDKQKIFYSKHIKTFHSLAKKVDPHVISSIICIETLCGDYTGKYSTIKALANVVANDHPDTRHRLHGYMTNELGTLIALDYYGIVDTETLKGSWDGGIGLAQFMPSSYMKYAISNNQDTPNLFKLEDAILSIENYLIQHGWRTGQPIVTQVPSTPHIHQLMNQKYELKCTPVICPSDTLHTPNKIIKAELNNETTYWYVFDNQSAIKAYNPRPNYILSTGILANLSEAEK
ncbi:lytic murein transglycosylase [Candidatus Comchoanobacter bicostacola]|uniref:Lytic murein transglycosylase n=1 Tax=Candidatus Comchoanobacter bicostacola TaxID=2919598 RepID=A0ABY5DL39_9GAMM|nr:lytic murein transglycosylase [Candidatus Comchoanobacter bicostacola]UTC24951.1 lytic murein transglycosylase [Candidatus Comchoanobacter bicostacola]